MKYKFSMYVMVLTTILAISMSTVGIVPAQALKPGWVLGPEWQVGPTAVSSGQTGGLQPDPALDHTPTADNYVAGVILGGNASTGLHGYYYLTTPVINTAAATGTLTFEYYRWLNSDYTPYMQNTVEIWNGSSWVILWSTGGSATIDTSWVYQTFNITAYKNPNMQIRFGFMIGSSGVYTAPSWNVDDVRVFDANGDIFNETFAPAGVTVTPNSGLITTEVGGTATFTAVLINLPTANVTIGLSSSNTAEGTVSPTSLTFTPANWNVPQTVTVTGVDDFLSDGNIAYTIITAAATSADANYNGLNPSDVNVTNNDNEFPGAFNKTAPANGATSISITPTLSWGASSGQTDYQYCVDPNINNMCDSGGVWTSTTNTTSAVLSGLAYNNQYEWQARGTNVNGNTEANGGTWWTFTTTCLATSTVTSNANSGAGTLRQAIADVCSGGTINFANPGMSGQTITLTTGELVINKNVTIDGSALASQVTVSGNNASRVFNINGAYTVNINSLKIINGSSLSSGAGILNTGGTLTVTNSTISGNTANSGGGIYNLSSGTLTVTNSTISGNTASSGPGGIANASGSTLTVRNSTISGNSSTNGSGGIGNSSSTLTVANSTISGNIGFVGGIRIYGASIASIINSTISGNSGSSGSGGIQVEAGTLNLTNTILADNTTGGDCVAAVALTSSKNNLIEDSINACGLTNGDANGNIVGLAPHLSLFGSYGGSTQTFALLPGSPAINAGDSATCAGLPGGDLDQRGLGRMGTCDIGSFESQGFAFSNLTGTPQSTHISTAFAAPLTLTITANNIIEPVNDGTITFSAPAGAVASLATTSYSLTIAGGMVSQNVAANNTAGSYIVVASATGAVSDNFVLSNTAPGVTVTPTSGLVSTEAGGTASFTVVLNDQPTADVTIGLSSSNTAEGTVSPASLTFTSLNWNTPQTVTLTGVDDFIDDGDVAYSIITANAVSADGGYSGMVVADVSATNTDDDTAGVSVTPTSGLTTTEAGGTASFDVVLDSQPAADVVIDLASSDTTEGTLAVSAVTFTSLNWNSPQTVTVTGVDDFVDDGDTPYTIVTANAVSADGGYSGMAVADVSLTNTDDDTAGISISPTSGLVTTEFGGTASFDVVLDSQPLDTVVMGLSSSNTAEGTLAITDLTFTPVNWNVPQTVTVTGVDDFVADGDIAYQILTAAATSTDPKYNTVNPADVDLTNTDNDVPGVTVSSISGNTTEAGGTADFTVQLNTQPTADVTLGLSSSDTTEGTITVASLTFTALNWNSPQTVTVTGVDDFVDDGDLAYTILTAAATSTDPNYSGSDPADVAVINLNDDTAGFSITPASGLTTSEFGGSAAFTVVLTSQPTATVTLGLSSSDTTEGTVAPASLAFTTANWNTPQTVTVTGVDDLLVDGNLAYQILSAAAASADPNYGGADPIDVSLINTDNEFDSGLLKNGSFEFYPASSTLPSFWNVYGGFKRTTAPIKFDKFAFTVKGLPAVNNFFVQTVNHGGHAGDAYTLSYWVKGLNVPAWNPYKYACQAQVLFHYGNVLKGVKTLNCPTGTFDYRFAAFTATAPADYTKIVVKFIYYKPSGQVWFDGLKLTPVPATLP